MKLNGLDIKPNFFTKKGNKVLKNAFEKTSVKARKNENNLENAIISKEKYQEKEVKIIKKFFESILTEKDAKKLFETCLNYQDYHDVFEKFVKILILSGTLSNIIKKVKKRTKK